LYRICFTCILVCYENEQCCPFWEEDSLFHLDGAKRTKMTTDTMMAHCPPPPPTAPPTQHTQVLSGPSIPRASLLTKANHNREESTATITTTTSTSTLVSPKLRSNLMREQKERDPLFFYEVVQTLGVGSMGSVARVRKRQDRVGGSARKDIQEAVRAQNRRKQCLNIPIIGGLFRLCIDDDLTIKPQRESKFLDLANPAKYLKETGNTNHRHAKSSVLIPAMEAIDTVSKGSKSSTPVYFENATDSTRSFGTYSSQQSGSVAVIEYAMKSIHLNRVAGETFIAELKNEIQILKELDHPFIVRAIETFEYRNQIFIVMELCGGGKLLTNH
jgi:serine/threonine protein kinase